MADELDRTRPGREAPDDTFAVVGMSCRLPRAPDPAAFRQLLRTGAYAIIETPAGRWAATGVPPAGPGPGAGVGGLLDDVDRLGNRPSCFIPGLLRPASRAGAPAEGALKPHGGWD